MSRETLRQRAGWASVVFAVVVFAIGMTAAVALGWENEQQPKEHGKNEQQGKQHGNKENENENENEKNKPHQQGNQQPPTPTTPTTPAQPPQTVPAPPQPAPAQAPSPVGARGAPEQQPSAGGKEVAQTPAAESAPALAPVSEQQKLARTGLDPALIALLGVVCLGGGAFLFRRAMAR
jgi:cytoskeletal protein RodZ